MVGNGLISRLAVASKHHFPIQVMPPLFDNAFFSMLLFKQLSDLVFSVSGEAIFFLVFNKGEVAVLEVLRY